MFMFLIIKEVLEDRLYESEIKNIEFPMMGFSGSKWRKLVFFL
jgi:hypothetical protein